MALAAALAELQAQARCPVCLAPLRDPVTLDCGHNCCAPCLRQRWAGLLDVLPCPVCQHHCPARAVPRNPLLAALADLLRPLDHAGDQGARLGEEEEEEALCARHPRAPALFCEEYLELLCGLCATSAPHRGLLLVLAERAAARHREALKGRLEPLGQQLEAAERGLAQQVCRSRELREQVDARRSELGFELEDLKRFLGREHHAIETQILSALAMAHGKALSGRRNLLCHVGSLRNLLGAVTALCARRDAELLGGRRQRAAGVEPVRRPADPGRLFLLFAEGGFSPPTHYLSLQHVVSRFQADLTLDPETAHRSLLISVDRKTAVFSGAMAGPDAAPRSRAFTSHQAVLGAEAFQGGRHFWQVDIRGSGVWSLGVCEESFPRSTPTPPCPSHGCWQFRGSTRIYLDPRMAQIRVGVFLDCDLGVISFYNLENRTHLQTLTGAVADRLLPYFSAGPCLPSFSMTLVTDAC